ncbi:LacI family DNA-binding transcriptional regulator [Oceanicoccus sagamiensis]|uniref:LacI family transcriptional regulator n=1 Tax=Oceanicoccus sagamiensis TaxID=716816 RepID=A0A1X9NMG5_9GAMM|nr:LacI family DNA-binding transcriptional regulator [Oceanicoccus sagamiensis]ARN75103.1 LacI family transcriptional regulator [Oceanicoccus sagamiensis]
MRATINDVAERAGVSIKTVSRVMNNEPSVRKPTQEKVLEAVKALNYQPNAAARNLAGTKSYALAFIYDNPNAYYIIDMQNGILSACNEEGFELLIHPCNAKSQDIDAELTAMIKRSRVSGLILTPPFSEMPSVISTLEKLDVKFVRILSGAGPSDDRSPCVFIDDHQAAFAITEHLIASGHQDIGFLCGDKEHNSSQERLMGYKAALKKNGIKINRSLILAGEYSFESGVKGAQKLLAKENKPTAIFASNDEIAAGALFAARLMNIAIPSQLAITGFEDSPFSRQTWPKLTTAEQPTSTIAQSAANLLIKATRNQSDDSEDAIFTPQLIIRESTEAN